MSDRRKKKVPRHIVPLATAAIAAIPLLLLVFLIHKNVFNFPYYDEWQFVQFLDAWKAGSLHMLGFAVQHNEHRLLFPRLIMFVLAVCTGWNVVWENAVSVLLAMLLLAALTGAAWRQARRTETRMPLWTVPVLSVFVFSWAQMENWVWGWQLQVFLCAACAGGALLLLSEFPRSWGAFAGAACLAFVAAFSFAGGLPLWIAALPVAACAPGLPRESKIARGVVWALLGVIVWQLFLTGYEKPEVSPSILTALTHPLLFGGYIVLYIGSPVAAFLGTPPWHGPNIPEVNALQFLSGLAGFAIFAGASWRVWTRRPEARPHMLAWAGLAGYALLAAATTSAGRAEFGLGHALTSRYITLGNMFWYGLAGMIALALPAPSECPLSTRRFAAVALVGLLAMCGAQWTLVACNRPWEDICRWKRMGWEGIAAGYPAKLYLNDLCDDPEKMQRDYLPTLKRLGLCGMDAYPIKHPARAAAFIAEGRKFLEQNKPATAATYFETATVLDPANAQARQLLAETLAKRKPSIPR